MSGGDPAGLGLDSLRRWIRSASVPMDEPVAAWLISGGRSNLTFGLRTRDGTSYCLRRPPLGTRPGRAHDVLREHRIIEALAPTPVPVPRTIAACEDVSVLGAPFFVMEFVDGVVCADAEAAGAMAEPARRTAGCSMVEMLGRLHDVDLEAVGLDGLARHDGYAGRQLRTFSKQLTDEDVASRPRLRTVADVLQRRAPTQRATALVHGDFKLGNCIHTTDGTVAAVLDWELTTIGDPLADLGWLLASWSDPTDTAARVVTPAARAPGFPSAEELAGMYAARSSIPVDDLPYYVALAQWKWACIDVGTHKRFVHGQMGDAAIDLHRLELQIDDRLESAAALVS